MTPKIRWGTNPDADCGHYWDSGTHRCVKDFTHTTDPTDDDHQCCCGRTTEET